MTVGVRDNYKCDFNFSTQFNILPHYSFMVVAMFYHCLLVDSLVLHIR